MRSIEEIKNNKNIEIKIIMGNEFIGSVVLDGVECSLIFTIDGNREHVSVAPYNDETTPTWEMMCQLKDIIFKDEELVYQIHPPKSEYVNLKNNCLHMWHIF